jgi:hypothetical protein
MGWLNTIFQQLFKAFNWFYTVVPWERAVRVRMGKHLRVMGPGIHIQIPFIDKVYLCNIRDRVINTTAQTLTTMDGVTLTCCVGIRFEIVDVEPMYNRLHQAADTIAQEVEGRVSDYVIHRKAEEITPASLERDVLSKIDMSDYGLKLIRVFLTDFVKVKTYRFIQGGLERWTEGGNLNLNRERKNSSLY